MMMRHQVRVLKSILSKPAFPYSTSVTSSAKTPKPVFKRLLDEFNEAKSIILKLKTSDAMKLNFKEWKSRIDLMQKIGFNDIECFHMISRYPLILNIPLPTFQGSLLQWQMSDIGMQNVMSVLLSQPALLEVKETVIRKRMPQLRVIFGSSNSITMLLKNSPNVMIDDWQAVLSKLSYFLETRRYKPGLVAECGAMSKSLDFIKFRFDLLEKCGVYKQSKVPIHKENKYDRSGHINPSLKTILMTNVEAFGKIAHISEEEYRICRELFMTNENEDEDDSDSEN